ncbi:MAG: hypothetical protein ACK56K_10360, partial [Akkermansiaceae bacterium]
DIARRTAYWLTPTSIEWERIEVIMHTIAIGIHQKRVKKDCPFLTIRGLLQLLFSASVNVRVTTL